ncbi:MAG: virulence RhuM family protein [Rickettsia endosymbiont of Glossina mortisans submortisans]|nr:virulence RhuM family protein [Rickettsia endosymbiont of Glossina mortisans submortisans]
MADNSKKGLEKAAVAFFATVQIERERSVKRQVEYYNLDAIILVGYSVNSRRGIAFRKWATKLT